MDLLKDYTSKLDLKFLGSKNRFFPPPKPWLDSSGCKKGKHQKLCMDKVDKRREQMEANLERVNDVKIEYSFLDAPENDWKTERLV